MWSPASGAQTIVPGQVRQVGSAAATKPEHSATPPANNNAIQFHSSATRPSSAAPPPGPAPTAAGPSPEPRPRTPHPWRPAEVGYPVSARVCGLRSGGCFQNFQKGVIMYSPASGAFSLSGERLRVWQRTGFENGSLGYPTSGQTCGLKDQGCFQNFERASDPVIPHHGHPPHLPRPVPEHLGRVRIRRRIPRIPDVRPVLRPPQRRMLPELPEGIHHVLPHHRSPAHHLRPRPHRLGQDRLRNRQPRIPHEQNHLRTQIRRMLPELRKGLHHVVPTLRRRPHAPRPDPHRMGTTRLRKRPPRLPHQRPKLHHHQHHLHPNLHRRKNHLVGSAGGRIQPS